MYKINGVFILSMLVIALCNTACRKSELRDHDLKDREYAKKDYLISVESSEMVEKRLYEVTQESDKLKRSKEELKIRIQAVFDSSRKAIEVCRKSNYTVPYKPDWGGREEILRKIQVNEIMPEKTVKEKKLKQIQIDVDRKRSQILSDLKSGLIDMSKHSEMNLEISKKALSDRKEFY